jgi:hypothetical protein
MFSRRSAASSYPGVYLELSDVGCTDSTHLWEANLETSPVFGGSAEGAMSRQDAGLILKDAVFTVIVPGTVTYWLPRYVFDLCGLHRFEYTG